MPSQFRDGGGTGGGSWRRFGRERQEIWVLPWQREPWQRGGWGEKGPLSPGVGWQAGLKVLVRDVTCVNTQRFVYPY